MDLWIFGFSCFVLTCVSAQQDSSHAVFTSTDIEIGTEDQPDLIHISVVACGTDRLEETMVMFKSAVMFTHAPMHFHVFADDEVRPLFIQQLEKWPKAFRSKYEYSLYPIIYPPGEIDWKKVFKPCATQRLFIPYLVDAGIEQLLYVDTDILFLRPVDDLWAHFRSFNSTQMAALSPEHEQPWQGWYNRFARHPYYGKMGVNSGVLLMHPSKLRSVDWITPITQYYQQYEYLITWGDQDLINIFFHYHPGVNSGVMLMSPQRMRAGAWQVRMIEHYKVYRLNMTWGDQDLINIYFSFHPERLYVFGCEWNYRADHCMYGSNCVQADKDGASVLHGNRGYYHNDKQPAFKAVYQALRDYPLGTDMKQGLIAPLSEKLKDAAHSYCGKVPHILSKQLEIQAKLQKLDISPEKQEQEKKVSPEKQEPNDAPEIQEQTQEIVNDVTKNEVDENDEVTDNNAQLNRDIKLDNKIPDEL